MNIEIAEVLRYLDTPGRVALKHEFALFDKHQIPALNVARASDDERLADDNASCWQRGVPDSDEVADARVLVADKLCFREYRLDGCGTENRAGHQPEYVLFERAELSHKRPNV